MKENEFLFNPADINTVYSTVFSMAKKKSNTIPSAVQVYAESATLKKIKEIANVQSDTHKSKTDKSGVISIMTHSLMGAAEMEKPIQLKLFPLSEYVFAKDNTAVVITNDLGDTHFFRYEIKNDAEEKKDTKTVPEKVSELLTEINLNPPKFRVIHDWIVVDLLEIKPIEKTKTGLFISPNIEKKDTKEIDWEDHPAQGIVVGVGSKVTEVALHDYIYLVKTPTKSVLYKGKWYGVVQTPDVVCVVG